MLNLKASKALGLTDAAGLLVATHERSNNDVPYRSAECLLLAQSEHGDRAHQCPLSGVKQTLIGSEVMSAFDPKRTLVTREIAVDPRHTPSVQ